MDLPDAGQASRAAGRCEVTTPAGLLIIGCAAIPFAIIRDHLPPERDATDWRSFLWSLHDKSTADLLMGILMGVILTKCGWF